MTVMNQMDRFDLDLDAIDRLPYFANKAAYLKQEMKDKLVETKYYIRDNGMGMPEIRDWKWKN
jgi:xylulose-5-phosphate/fructose-6-phosphate phosphoketolase